MMSFSGFKGQYSNQSKGATRHFLKGFEEDVSKHTGHRSNAVCRLYTKKNQMNKNKCLFCVKTNIKNVSEESISIFSVSRLILFHLMLRSVRTSDRPICDAGFLLALQLFSLFF